MKEKLQVPKETASARPNNYLHYKEYVGSVEFSEDDAVFYGKVVGIKALISFEGDSVSAITEDFHNAVDEYLKNPSRGLSTCGSEPIYIARPCLPRPRRACR